MFKTSVPFTKVKTFTNWCEFFDCFYSLVKNEDILEEYSEILESNENSLVDFFSGYAQPTPEYEKFRVITDDVSNIRVIIEGSKDHQSMRFSIEGFNETKVKVTLPAFILTNDGFKFI